MFKKEKIETKISSLSDWEIFPWSQEMYERHEADFQIILKEYREIKKINNEDTGMARLLWIEKKGGGRVFKNEYGNLQFEANERYQHFSNMFERFDDWLSFQEKKSMSHEVRGEKIRSMFMEAKKPSMSIPQNIKDGAERDVSNEERKREDVNREMDAKFTDTVSHALDNF